MYRYTKLLGGPVIAFCMLSAIVVPSASATGITFNVASTPAKVTSKKHAGNDVFTVHAGTVSCGEVTYEGEVTTSPTSSLTVTPSYGSCTAFGFANVPIDVNGCTYTLSAVTNEGGSFEGSMDINCSANPITITSPGCTVTIGSQKGRKKVTFTNFGAAETREVTADGQLSGLAYEEHNKGIFPTCAFNTKPTTTGTLTYAFLSTAENPVSKAHIGMYAS